MPKLQITVNDKRKFTGSQSVISNGPGTWLPYCKPLWQVKVGQEKLKECQYREVYFKSNAKKTKSTLSLKILKDKVSRKIRAWTTGR